jgi:hypothetical protein
MFLIPIPSPRRVICLSRKELQNPDPEIREEENRGPEGDDLLNVQIKS